MSVAKQDYKSIQDILVEFRVQDWEVIQYTLENCSDRYSAGYGNPHRAKLYLEIFKGPKAVEKEKRYAEYLKLKKEFEPDEC